MFYSSLATIMIWLILKIIGIIQTPVWLEYGVPVTSLVIAVFSLFHELIKDLTSIKIDVAELKINVTHLDKDMGVVKRDMTIVKNELQIA